MRPCDYGMCNEAKCIEEDCLLPQYPYPARVDISPIKEKKEVLYRYTVEDLVRVHYVDGSIVMEALPHGPSKEEE